MALVFFEIFFSILEILIKHLSLTSTNTGFAPTLTIAETVGIAVKETVITSSPGLMPDAIKATINASVPVFTAIPYFELLNFKNFF